MTIAEQKALKAYPENAKEVWGPLPGASKPCIIDDNLKYRVGYVEGYNEAITDAIDRLNEALDIDGSYLRELLTEPEKL